MNLDTLITFRQQVMGNQTSQATLREVLSLFKTSLPEEFLPASATSAIKSAYRGVPHDGKSYVNLSSFYASLEGAGFLESRRERCKLVYKVLYSE